MFMSVDRAGSGQADLFWKIALGDFGINGGTGQARHKLGFLEPYNSMVHGVFLFLCKAVLRPCSTSLTSTNCLVPSKGLFRTVKIT